MSVPNPTAPLVELASGVDALYLSGRASLSPHLFDALAQLRDAAEEADESMPFRISGDEWLLEPRSFGRYRYRLSHPYGLIGITPSENLPSFRVQPRAEFLHGAGPRAVLEYFNDAGEYLAGGPVDWSLSRLDLFCDVQGWQIGGDDRRRFVSRSDARLLRESADDMTGFEFGRRTTKTVCARIYDKTLQVDKKGLDWWPPIWGDKFDRGKQVLRVEIEIGRQGLVEYGINTPTQGLQMASEVWASATSKWLTYRDPSSDATRSRWPIAAEWVDVQNATLRGDAVGIDRIRRHRRKGELRIITPAMIGYLARCGALCGTDDLPSTLGAVRHLVERDERRRGVLFSDRIAERVAEEARR